MGPHLIREEGDGEWSIEERIVAVVNVDGLSVQNVK